MARTNRNVVAAESPRYIVMTAKACMPSSCKFGDYRRVAVVECNPEVEQAPKQIHPRHKAVARIVATWERLNVGRTTRDAFSRALRAAHDLVAELEDADRRAHAADVRRWLAA